MNNQIKVLDLLNQKQNKEIELESLVHGSVEIREKDEKKYIYTHAREDGLQTTKYIGEYTEELYNLILNNNIKADQLYYFDKKKTNYYVVGQVDGMYL